MNTDQVPTRFQGKHVDITDAVLRIFFEVYNELGYGFLESVYHAAMLLALRDSGLRAAGEVPVPVHFRGHAIGIFKADIIVNEVVLLELKAVSAMDKLFEAQALHYLQATDIEVGLLLNFGPKPQLKRMILDNERKNIRVHP